MFNLFNIIREGVIHRMFDQNNQNTPGQPAVDPMNPVAGQQVPPTGDQPGSAMPIPEPLPTATTPEPVPTVPPVPGMEAPEPAAPATPAPVADQGDEMPGINPAPVEPNAVPDQGGIV